MFRTSAARRKADWCAARRFLTCFSPQRLKPLRAPAIVFVEFIADWILLVEVLMVLLCGIKLGRRGDFGDNGFFKRLRLVQPLFRFFGQPLLIVVMIKNGGTILMAFVTELLIRGGWIDVVPEHIQQCGVADLLRVVHDLD